MPVSDCSTRTQTSEKNGLLVSTTKSTVPRAETETKLIKASLLNKKDQWSDEQINLRLNDAHAEEHPPLLQINLDRSLIIWSLIILYSEIIADASLHSVWFSFMHYILHYVYINCPHTV